MIAIKKINQIPDETVEIIRIRIRMKWRIIIFLSFGKIMYGYGDVEEPKKESIREIYNLRDLIIKD